MVPQQVLRIALGLATLAAVAGPAAADGIERIAVIDLRPEAADTRAQGREAVTAALRDHEGLWPVDDAKLAAALAGERHDPHAREAADALAGAKRAYGSLDCPTASAAGQRAVNALAAAQALAADVTDDLIQAYAYVLLCSGDDPARGLAVATQLRGLDADPPPGISASVWANYPAIDATSNVFLVDVEITSTPAGANLWIDHRRVGPAPMKLHLAEGEHIIAAAAAGGSTVQRLMLRGRDARTLEVGVAAVSPDRWQPVREWVDGWRSGARAPTPHDIHGLLTTVDTRVAILLTRDLSSGTDRVEAWAIHPERKLHNALLIGSSKLEEIGNLNGLVLRTTHAWDSGAPGPNENPIPIPAPGEDSEPKKAKPWWVYATIVGAVALGGALVLANDLADDHQVIRLEYP